MASLKPANVAFTRINNGGHKPLGQAIPLDFEGDFNAAHADKKVGVLITVTHRTNGIPFTQTLHADEAQTHATNNAKFKHKATLPSFTPAHAAVYSIRIVTWARNAAGKSVTEN